MSKHNDPEIARQESTAARQERGYLESEKAATRTEGIYCGMCGDTGKQNGVKCPQPSCRAAAGEIPVRVELIHEETAHEMPERVDGHIQVVHQNCPRTHCPICEGGLFMCSRCGSAEGATTTECPGERMTWAQVDAVYAGKLDFRGGKWVNECSPHVPTATVPRLDMTEMLCQEASQFSTTRYLACSQPATKLVLSERGRRLYPMCDMCADHNIRNRRAKLAAVHEAMNV